VLALTPLVDEHEMMGFGMAVASKITERIEYKLLSLTYNHPTFISA